MTGAGAGARRLSNWHRFIVGIAVSTVIVETTAVGAIAAAIAIRACRSIGGGGSYRGGNDVSVRGRLVSNAVTHPMAVLATGVEGPFESRRCPADPGHVALSPAPFTVGHRASAAIPLEATLRCWYRRRMAPRVQNSPSAVLAADRGAAIAAGG